MLAACRAQGTTTIVNAAREPEIVDLQAFLRAMGAHVEGAGTSTVVIDKYEEEPGKKVSRMVRIAATIVVERDGHKAMVIGDKGERIKRIGMEARQELEKLMDAKVFLELWVKVRSGWADDEARVRSFGYE